MTAHGFQQIQQTFIRGKLTWRGHAHKLAIMRTAIRSDRKLDAWVAGALTDEIIVYMPTRNAFAYTRLGFDSQSAHHYI